MSAEIQVYLDSLVANCLKELRKPENFDLTVAIAQFDAEGGFMFGFSTPHAEALDFDGYSHLVRVIMPPILAALGDELQDIVDMSVEYDRYLRDLDARRDASGISETQAARWDAIVEKYDEGISGSMYGWVCRTVQSHIQKAFAEN